MIDDINIVGQDRLFTQLKNYTLTTLPKTTLLLGEEGCGKHTAVKFLANNLDLEIVEVEDSTQLLEFAHCSIPKLYLINIDNFNEKEQNKFLKFIEEPSNCMHVVLIAKSTLNVLKTILDRCFKLCFDDYSIDDLKSICYCDNLIVYQLCKTPGQLLKFDIKQLNELQVLCDNILQNAHRATFANMLSLSLKFNYSDYYDKFDVQVFLRLLQLKAYELYITDNCAYFLDVMSLASKYLARIVYQNISKENTMFKLLSELHSSAIKNMGEKCTK